MTGSKSHDPVTALSESAATGRTAEIFADIREVMEIPIITSIWRVLAGMENGLESAWSATRPIYESGQPQAALAELAATLEFPVPEPLSADLLWSAGVPRDDLPDITAIIDAYTRSNSLNLIALYGLISDAPGAPELPTTTTDTAPLAVTNSRPLMPLLEREEIESSTWSLLEEISFLGSSDPDPSIATLWRHLAHWPELLRLIIDSYSPLQGNGTLAAASADVVNFAKANAPRMARHRGEIEAIPADALDLVTSYVSNPGAVSRMVMLGHSVRRWLEPAFSGS